MSALIMRRSAQAAVLGTSLAAFGLGVVAAPAVAGGNGGHQGPPGDNGTVKTHNPGTPTDDMRDEPKLVCNGSYLDAFFFDGSQQVSWWFVEKTHGPTVLSGTITLDSNGHGVTGGLAFPHDGMYKLYWTFAGEHGSAKHKVVQVKGCEQSPSPSPTPTPAPTPTPTPTPTQPPTTPPGGHHGHNGSHHPGHHESHHHGTPATPVQSQPAGNQANQSFQTPVTAATGRNTPVASSTQSDSYDEWLALSGIAVLATVGGTAVWRRKRLNGGLH